MQILSEQERSALLSCLQDAPDEILVDAVRQKKDWMKTIRSSFDEVRAMVGMWVDSPPRGKPPYMANPPEVKPLAPEPEAPEPRKDVSPGKSMITRIGANTEAELLGVLKTGRQPNHDRYGEHLKLLYARGKVKYDGKEYYV